MTTQPPSPTMPTASSTDTRPHQADDPDLPLFAYRRGNGKIAKLPKQLRDVINESLADGCEYRYIIDTLREYGHYLTPNNLSQWKKHGYQQWLLEQQFLAKTRLREDTATDLSGDFNAHDLSHATLQLALLQMFDAIRALSAPAPAAGQPSESTSDSRSARSRLDAVLGGDSKTFFNFVNTVTRASKELIKVQDCRNQSKPRKLQPVALPGFNFTRPKPARKTPPAPAAPAPARVTPPLALPAPKTQPASPANSRPLAQTQPNGKSQTSSSIESPASSNPANPISTPPARPTPSAPSATPLPEQPSVPVQTNGERSSVAAEAKAPEIAPQPDLPKPGDSPCPEPPPSGRGQPVGQPVPVPASPPSDLVPQLAPAGLEHLETAAPQPKTAGTSTEEPNPSGYPPEFCLNCETRLPNRLANTSRPFANCRSCDTPLPLGLCNLSSLEKCPRCLVPLPRPHPNGRRPQPACHSCGLPLGDPPQRVMVIVREYWRQREAESAQAPHANSPSP